MLNRRHLRVKVLQSLYAYFQRGDYDIVSAEKELVKSVNKVYDLYLSKLLFFVELKHIAEKIIESNKAKLLPTEEDLNPNLSFVNNRILTLLEQNEQLAHEVKSRCISWNEHRDAVKKIFLQIQKSVEYQTYLNKVNKSFKDDLNFIVTIFRNYIAENELLEFIFEEQSIFWLDDFYLVNKKVIETLESFDQSSDSTQPLLGLFKDPDDDKDFLLKLFRYTIVNTDKYEKYIVSKLENWDPNRVALMDMLIMKIALAELINFPTIPVKVTLNEYIELSKDYSTNKSKIFVNGILDKLVLELKTKGEIIKVGRGLVE